MYAILLWLHSWLRWIVLGIALVVIVRAVRGQRQRAPWTRTDERWTRLFLGALDLQVTLGLLLYVALSPIVHAALRDLRSAMRSSVLRFFAIEHITAMLIAIAVAHIGVARAGRLGDAPGRHRRMLFVVSAFALCALVGIPWPSRPYGRPLARTALDAPQTAASPDLYAARCAVCHGPGGQGDGVASGSMQPRPRDFRDRTWQRSVSDRRIAEVIARGGTAHGLSTNMPPNPDLNSAEIAQLVAFVRAASAP